MSDKQQSIFPGDYIELASHIPDGTPVAVELRSYSRMATWMQPSITTSVCGFLRIPNLSPDIVMVKKHEHVAQYHLTCTLTNTDLTDVPHQAVRAAHIQSACPSKIVHSDPVRLDPDMQLSIEEKKAFTHLHRRYDQVFHTQIGKYNDASGRLRASINMGPVEPPPQKARLPSYNSAPLTLGVISSSFWL